MTDLFKMAVDKWGEPAQVDMMIEEMAELIKALLKLRRLKYTVVDIFEKEHRIAHIKEEMADVDIMLQQMKYLYGGYDEEFTNKITRLEEKLIND